MKKVPVILALIAAAIVAYSMSNYTDYFTAIKPSNNIATETRKVSDFDRIEVEGIFQVDVTYSSNEEIEIKAPENLHQYIELTVKSGTLHIEIKKKTKVNSPHSINVHISTAKLNGFELSGASSVHLNNQLKDNNLSIESSGAAYFEGDVNVREAELELSGAANVLLSGMATDANLELSGASHVKDYAFEVDNLDVELSGASSLKITTLKRLEGDISGASSLRYDGNPSIKNIATSGASHVKHK